jgi:hypothetical protein
MLYGASVNSFGTQLVGYVWQQIKVATIMLTCSQGEGTTCPCPTSQAWNYATYNCVEVVCLQAEYATGVVKGNAC